MSSNLSTSGGNAWEANVVRWLHLKHPNDFQPVPATDGGDGGIEGYCISERTVYQCYSPLENLDTKSLYEKQRDKLTEDVGKFINNTARLKRILPAGFKVRRYDFVVREMRSSEIVSHANAQAERVRASKLPHVDADFAIMVRDEKYFQPQIATENAHLLARLNIDNEDVAPEEVDDWATQHNAGVLNIDRKVRLYTTLRHARDIQVKRRYWIEVKIRAENALEKLRRHSEEIWEKLWSVKRSRERLLAGRYGEASGSGTQQVRIISDELARDMIQRVPNLQRLDADMLAEGLVGEWLQNCKLDFPDHGTGKRTS